MFPIKKIGHEPLVPVVVSIPHYGTGVVPGFDAGDFASERFATFPVGYTDSFSPQVYGSLDAEGAQVVATPYSRMFVDVNRRRNDYQIIGAQVRSKSGVFRTHSIDDRPMFSRALSVARAEQWLSRFYDPYHETLRRAVCETVGYWGEALLIDAHTASPNGMQDQQVILGTAHGRTADDAVLQMARSVFEDAGFDVSVQAKRYSGGYTVKHYGLMRNAKVQAIQIEFNAGLFTPLSRRQYIENLLEGGGVVENTEVIATAQASIAALIRRYAESTPTSLRA